MGRHAAPPRKRATGSRRGRATALWVTAAAVVVLALGVDGTYAYWNDQAVVAGDTVTAGRVDLDVNGEDSAVAVADLGYLTLLPGGSVATVITVHNAGTVPLTWTASSSATGAGWQAALSARVTADTTVTGSKPAASCPGQTLTGASTTVGGDLVTQSRQLAAGASEKVCLQLTLRPDAPSSLQGTSTVVSVVLTGTQLLS